MRQLIAFIQKEYTELVRTGKATILLILFVLFGIMSPALAKLTPWMFQTMSASLAEQGIVVEEMTVDAMTSWGQFFKNGFMELIVIVVMFAGILTSEYQKGTLVIMLTKGMNRYKVILAKSILLFCVWTICYWLSVGITYGYNAWFWDNSAAQQLLFALACPYVMGLWLLSVVMLSSAIAGTTSFVMLITGGAAVISYLLGMIPKFGRYLPTKLMEAGELTKNSLTPDRIMPAFIVTLVLIAAGEILAVLIFQKKRV